MAQLGSCLNLVSYNWSANISHCLLSWYDPGWQHLHVLQSHLFVLHSLHHLNRTITHVIQSHDLSRWWKHVTRMSLSQCLWFFFFHFSEVEIKNGASETSLRRTWEPGFRFWIGAVFKLVLVHGLHHYGSRIHLDSGLNQDGDPRPGHGAPPVFLTYTEHEVDHRPRPRTRAAGWLWTWYPAWIQPGDIRARERPPTEGPHWVPHAAASEQAFLSAEDAALQKDGRGWQWQDHSGEWVTPLTLL